MALSMAPGIMPVCMLGMTPCITGIGGIAGAMIAATPDPADTSPVRHMHLYPPSTGANRGSTCVVLVADVLEVAGLPVATVPRAAKEVTDTSSRHGKCAARAEALGWGLFWRTRNSVGCGHLRQPGA